MAKTETAAQRLAALATRLSLDSVSCKRMLLALSDDMDTGTGDLMEDLTDAAGAVEEYLDPAELQKRMETMMEDDGEE